MASTLVGGRPTSNMSHYSARSVAASGSYHESPSTRSSSMSRTFMTDSDSSEGGLDSSSSNSSRTSVYELEDLPEKRYVLPDPHSQSEKERLDIQHKTWLLLLKGRLELVTLPREPFRALDVGCGSGAWASAFAKEHPESHIELIDVSPPSREDMPANCSITRANAEEPWRFAHGVQFDFIHVRMMMLAIQDWPAFFGRCMDHLKPGGWLEVDSTLYPFGAENKALAVHDSPFLHLWDVATKGMVIHGIDPVQPLRNPKLLREEGFANVKELHLHLPIGVRRDDPPERQALGRLTIENYCNMTPGFGAKCVAMVPGWTAEAAQKLVATGLEDTRKNINTILPYCPCVIHTAQKPRE